MATYPTAIHLCSGYGGFELALRPWGVRTVAHVERDSYAASILMERMEQERLDQAPIWDDIDTFDGEPWCGRVDILTAGFPCQPFSAAGARRGLDDDRWLWPSIARIVAQVRPRFVVLENVPPVVRHGVPAVLSDLAQLGFDAEWGLYSAADVGAPHRRQRWWCVAYTASSRWAQDRLYDTGNSGTPISSGISGNVGLGDSSVADTNSGDSAPWDRSRKNERSRRRTNIQSGSDDVADTEGDGISEIITESDSRTDADRSSSRTRPTRPVAVASATERGIGKNDIRAGTKRVFPPTRDDTEGWATWITEGRPQPVVCRDTDGPPTGLADALHLGGNGLVPQTATAAIRQLLERGGWQL